jgi:hypothetical protein
MRLVDGRQMIWNSWIKDPEVGALEQELSRLSIIVVKTNDYVRIGSLSTTKIFDIKTFKEVAAKVCEQGAKDRSHRNARDEKPNERTSQHHRRTPENGIMQADIDNAHAALSILVTRALQERDTWRLRAIEAEAKLTSYGTPPIRPANQSILMIKRHVVRALHPDGTPDANEKELRSKLFQQIWPLVEQLEGT